MNRLMNSIILKNVREQSEWKNFEFITYEGYNFACLVQNVTISNVVNGRPLTVLPLLWKKKCKNSRWNFEQFIPLLNEHLTRSPTQNYNPFQPKKPNNVKKMLANKI